MGFNVAKKLRLTSADSLEIILRKGLLSDLGGFMIAWSVMMSEWSLTLVLCREFAWDLRLKKLIPQPLQMKKHVITRRTEVHKPSTIHSQGMGTKGVKKRLTCEVTYWL